MSAFELQRKPFFIFTIGYQPQLARRPKSNQKRHK